MKKKYEFLILILVLFLLNLGYTSDYQGKKIAAIHFYGLKNTELNRIKPALHLLEGMEFDIEKANKDFRNIYDFGFFEDVRMEIIEKEEDKIIINYIVKERPWINKIEIRKKKNLWDKEYELLTKELTKTPKNINLFDFEYIILPTLKKKNNEEAIQILKNSYVRNLEDYVYTIKKGSDEKKILSILNSIRYTPVDPDDADLALSNKEILKLISNKVDSYYDKNYNNTDREKILQEFLKEGYIGTEVRFVDEAVRDTGVLVVEITQGKELLIQKVEVKGTGKIDEKDAVSSMQKIRNPLFFGIKHYPLVGTDFDEDREKLVQFGKNNGFINFKIKDINIKINVSLQYFFENIRSVLKEIKIEEKQRESFTQFLYQAIFEKNMVLDNTELDRYLKDFKEGKKEWEKESLDNLRQYIVDKFSQLKEDKENIAKILRRKLLITNIPLNIRVEYIPNEKKEDEGYYLSLAVEEGEQYIFGGIILQKNDKIPTKELLEYLDLEPGEVYNDSKFVDFMRSAYMTYQSNGFFYSKITPIPKIDEEKKVISYVIDIFEGEKVHIENMYIVGNSKTATSVIDREIRIKEGEIYDFSKIMRSRERLMKSQFFSNVTFEPKQGSEEGLVDIFWRVEEGKTGMLSIGGGYGTLSGFTFFGQISELNFLGLGYNLSLRGDYGQKSKSISTSFGSRYIGYTPISYNFSIAYTWSQVDLIPKYDRNHNGIWDKMYNSGNGYQIYDEGDVNFNNYVDEDRNGDGIAAGANDSLTDERFVKKQTMSFGLSLGYAFSEYWSISGGQSVFLSKYYDPKNIVVENMYQDKEYRLRSTIESGKFEITTKNTINLIYDSTDNYLTPTKGIIFNPSVTLYGIQGGYTQMMQYDVDLSGYLTLLSSKRLKWNMVWANHIGVTVLTPLFYKKEMQMFSEYRLSFDGMRELRGWEEKVYEENMKGLTKVSLGSELRIPIPGTENILWWAFFFDGGNVSKKGGFDDIPLKFKDYYYSVGGGFKVEIPMFPIRLYWAKRLLWEDGFFKDQEPGLGFSKWTFVLSISGFF